MKTLLSLLAAAWSGLACAAESANPGAVPEGLAPSDWSDIRSARDAARHAPQRLENGNLLARNPGQQWSAAFDGKGFTVTPDHGAWTWGLDLSGYGSRTLSPVASPSSLRHEGGKIICERDGNLSEWFINDSRGLEQGWDIQRRPERADPAAPLQLHLSTRGSVRAQVSAEGDSVSFLEGNGGCALTYGGLKGWDADGKTLPVRFEEGGGNSIHITIDDHDARYPITIDPIAQQAYLKPSKPGADDRFGEAVAISGDTLVVSAPQEDSASSGVNGDQTGSGASHSGAVYVFVRTGAVWSQQAFLKASNPATENHFGAAVAISGDTVIVGAPYEDSAATGVNGDQTSNAFGGSGAAYIFVRSGTTWTQQAYVKASNTRPSDFFGLSVAISGDTVVVGAPEEDSRSTGVNGDQTPSPGWDYGAAYVFTRSGTVWSQQAYLKASNGGQNDNFGRSVAISDDTVVVGAHLEDSGATGVNGNQTSNSGGDSGAAYIFFRNGTIWAQQAYLKASNTSLGGTTFGLAVAISGETVVIGGPWDGGGGPRSGAAYVFTRSGAVWSQQAYLKASNTGVQDYFGTSLSISGDTVVVGAPQEDSTATGVNGDQWNDNSAATGAAYVFRRNAGTWSQQAYLKASNTNYADLFGTAVAVSEDTVIAGAPCEDGGSSGAKHLHPRVSSPIVDSGAAYLFHLNLATLPPDIGARISGKPVDLGGTALERPAVIGSPRETTLEITNNGPGPLTFTGTPPVAITGSSEFSVSVQPATAPIPVGGSATFKVLFAPTGEGPRSATLSIPSNDDYNTPFVFQITAPGLSFTTDTDGDGQSDAWELNMETLNFDWQVKQPALVGAYLANVNRAGLYDPAQVHTLRADLTTIHTDAASGRVKLTNRWQKSTGAGTFFDFPVVPGSGVSISPSGSIEIEFAPANDGAAFLKFEGD